jgi:hypothetical protein
MFSRLSNQISPAKSGSCKQVLLLTPAQHNRIMMLREKDLDPFGLPHEKKVKSTLKKPRKKKSNTSTSLTASVESPNIDLCTISAATFRMDIRHRVFCIVNKRSELGKFRIRMTLSGWNLDLVRVIFNDFNEIETMDKDAVLTGATPVARPSNSTMDVQQAELGEAPFTTAFTCFLSDDLAAWCNFQEFDDVNGWGPCVTTSNTTASLCLELSVVVKIDKSLKPYNSCQVNLFCTTAVCIRNRELRIPPRCNQLPYYSEVVLPTAISTIQYLSSHRK